jgi:aspartate/methionine/tyrosine aminotransferase
MRKASRPGLTPFLAMQVMERARELEREGPPVVHFELGEPDLSPPRAAVDACAEALARGDTRYTDSRGLPELRAAIARDLARRFGVEVSPDRVLVTSGTSPALLIAFSLLIVPGDEVILPAPGYPCYPNFVRYCGGVPVPVRTDPASGHRLDVAAVARAITPRTVAIAVGSPANPTGAVQPAETMRGLASLGLPLVSDEIYDGIVYGDARTTSALTLPCESFVLDGFSKRYAMTGFRLGWVVLPEWAVAPARVLSQNLFISVGAFVQRAGVAALEYGGETLAEMRRVYERRRDRLVAGLRALGFGVPRAPDGAFYVLADARRFGSDSLALSSLLLERARVATTPGIDFGDAGEGWLRFCYAISEEQIELGLARLSAILPELEGLAQRSRAAAGAAR